MVVEVDYAFEHHILCGILSTSGCCDARRGSAGCGRRRSDDWVDTEATSVVRQWTQGGTRPAQRDLDKLSFGQMASRAVHDTDARLANELYALSRFLIFWPSTQPVRA
jgi:hypothetical protein